MRRKSQRIKVVIENSTTGEKRTVNFILMTPAGDYSQTNQREESAIIIRRMPGWKRLSKVRVEVI
jgi:hypothetical protein